ncbi:MAG: thermonuclease family protein [Devosia nanyangense]|uniref:Thermonuclease family protein n=1 Tax=Devosia nanyangense TaxID=1228055 RepID=A0A933NZU7_9HYPH|nr:thermonuclease family protein [Devosia nanyangense]
MALSLMSMPLASACEGLRDGLKGTVREIVDGDTVLLDTGLVVRLIGIQAPKLALGREGFFDWPKAGEARAALAAIALDKPVLLRFGGEQVDRYGRSLAQLYVTGATEVWVQRTMLEAGMARVYSFPDNRACLPELLAAENKARTAKLGIWTDPYYRVRRADRPADLLPLAGHYELIEGRVLKAERAGGALFLNFGRYFKEDFTAVIDARALRLFADEKLDPLNLAGALVRLRGWIDTRDGPRVEIGHPEQIEVLAVP